MTDAYEATLDGDLLLTIEVIEDHYLKSIAQYEFPYRDGAMLEDMGQRARVVRVRCYFINEDYPNHETLIRYLATTEDQQHELVHPQYGIILGQIQEVSVTHDDREDTAEVDLTFVEELRGIVDPEIDVSPDSATEEAFGTGMADIADEIFADLQDTIGAEAWTLNSTPLDWELPTMIQQFGVISTTARAYVREADRYVAQLDSYLNEVTNPANSLLGTMETPIYLCSILAAKIARTMERYAVVAHGLADYPKRFSETFRSSVAVVIDATPSIYLKPANMAMAQRAAVELGAIYKADRDNEGAWRTASKTRVWSPLGKRRTSAAITQPMTVTQIEAELATVRTMIQDALNGTKNAQSLKTMAAALTEYVVQIKADRPDLSAVTIDNTLPLHLICLKYGIPYGDAELLLAVNSIRQPSFVTGEIHVYER